MKRTTKTPAIAATIAAVFLTIILTNHAAQAQITIQSTNSYAAKFICGVQPDAALTSDPDVQAGHYSTKVNVHNNSGAVIRFRKKMILLRGGEVSIQPQFKTFESLNEDEAMEVVCKDIYAALNIKQNLGDPWRYIEGFVILEVYFTPGAGKPIVPPPDPLDVEGVYTYKGDLPGSANANASGVSINVVVFPAKSNGHILY
jgi:hypothetical protein